MRADDVQTVAVIGAGTMGAGIAGVLARAGRDVRLVDSSEALLERGMGLLSMAQEALTDAKLLKKRDGTAALKRIEPTAALDRACDSVQLLIEAVPEDLRLKQKMFAEFDQACPKRAILATNTSGLSVTKIAQATKRPNLVAGMHFWNPPHIMPLVEVTKGKRTSNPTARLLVDISRKIGKRPILVKHDVPGFVGNRLQFAVFREALHILSEGIASAEDIDTAMTAGPGLRWGVIGALRTADLGGLDVFEAISQYLFAQLNSKPKPPRALGELVKKGKFGAKSGQGFYKYPPKELKEVLQRRDRVLLEFLRILGVE